jgi:hypothetical protein
MQASSRLRNKKLEYNNNMTNEQLLERAESQLIEYRLKAEAAEDALRDIALYLSCGGYNDVGLVEFDPALYAKKIKETITEQFQREFSQDNFLAD